MALVFLVYGSAFLLATVVIFSQRRYDTSFQLADHIWVFALFCLLHGLNEWADMWTLLKGSSLPLDLLRPCLLTASFACLLEFGRRLAVLSSPRAPLMSPWLTPGLCLLTVALSAGSGADRTIWPRYILCLPGGLLSAEGMRRYYRDNREFLAPLRLGKAFAACVCALGMYAFFAGAVVPCAELPPAAWLNLDSFQAAVHVPVQVFRMLCAAVLAWSIWRILGLFDWEARDRLLWEIAENRKAQAEKERLDSEIQRTRRLDALGVLAGGIAHDFNNLLTIILGNAALVRKAIPAESGSAEALSDIEAAAKAASAVTRELMVFAKGVQPALSPLALGPFLREAVAAAAGDALRCEFELAERLCEVPADADLLRTAIAAVVRYAGLSLPPGGTLHVRAHGVDVVEVESAVGLPAGSFAQIDFEYAGVPIQPESLPRIFDPYFASKRKGLGLGLAVCRTIIVKHGGSAEIRSLANGATKISLRLPSKWTPPRETPAGSIAAPVQKILVMDDEALIRGAAKRVLCSAGYAVDVAADGEEAVDLYRAAQTAGSPYGLVILDLTVAEGVGGVRALAALKELDPAVAAIVSSGYSDDPVLSDYRHHGFIATLPKPYTPEDMVGLLEHLGAGKASAR